MKFDTSSKETRYWPFYCEENIYHLCHSKELLSFERKVVFISNRQRCVAMKNQGSAADSSVSWDYHVILLFRDNHWQVVDLDSRLARPCPVADYLALSFFPRAADFFPPLFRVVEAADFTSIFSSDRRHMRDEDGAWLQEPPPWSPIRNELKESFNLWDFVDMDGVGHGKIHTLEEMAAAFT